MINTLYKLKISLAFFAGLFLLVGCVNDPDEVASLTQTVNAPVEIAEDVELKYSEHGVIKVNVKATKMWRYEGEKPYMEANDGVELVFYDSLSNETSRLTALYAIHHLNDNIMKVRDSVKVVNVEGEKIETEELIWDERNSRISSDKFVKITTADEILTGHGFEANEDFTRYKIHKVEAIFKLREEEKDTTDVGEHVP